MDHDTRVFCRGAHLWGRPLPALPDKRYSLRDCRARKTHYPEDIVEVIAGVGLRDTLKIKENDLVNVEVAHD